MSDRPRTAEELLALPEGGGFGMAIRFIDGKKYQVPVAPDLVAFFSEPDDVIQCIDADGQPWRLARYADGRWCKRRVEL